MFIFLTTIQIVLSTEQFEKTWSDNINVKISNYFLAPFRFKDSVHSSMDFTSMWKPDDPCYLSMNWDGSK